MQEGKTGFQCLGGKTPFEYRFPEKEYGLSDHHPVIKDNICSFNVLTQCKKYPTFYNNTFQVEESDAEYENRLKKLIEALGELYDEGIKIFFLQEAPLYPKHKWFYEDLGKRIKDFDIKPEKFSKNGRPGLMCFAHKDLTVENITDETLKAEGTFNGLNNRGAFFHAIKVTNQETKNEHCFLNIHGLFDPEDQQNTVNAITMGVDKGYTCIGDFNLLPAHYKKMEIELEKQNIDMVKVEVPENPTHDGYYTKKFPVIEVIAQIDDELFSDYNEQNSVEKEYSVVIPLGKNHTRNCLDKAEFEEYLKTCGLNLKSINNANAIYQCCIDEANASIELKSFATYCGLKEDKDIPNMQYSLSETSSKGTLTFYGENAEADYRKYAKFKKEKNQQKENFINAQFIKDLITSQFDGYIYDEELEKLKRKINDKHYGSAVKKILKQVQVAELKKTDKSEDLAIAAAVLLKTNQTLAMTAKERASESGIEIIKAYQAFGGELGKSSPALKLLGAAMIVLGVLLIGLGVFFHFHTVGAFSHLEAVSTVAREGKVYGPIAGGIAAIIAGAGIFSKGCQSGLSKSIEGLVSELEKEKPILDNPIMIN